MATVWITIGIIAIFAGSVAAVLVLIKRAPLIEDCDCGDRWGSEGEPVKCEQEEQAVTPPVSSSSGSEPET